MSSPFTIDVLDASGNRLGEGPLTNITSLNDTQRIDAIGEVGFGMPADDPRTALIAQGRLFDIFDERDGYLGRYLSGVRNVQDSLSSPASVTNTLRGLLADLTGQSVLFGRTYDDQPIATVAAALLALRSGWTAEVESGLGNITDSFDGQNVFEAVESVANKSGCHFRLKPADPDSGLFYQTVEFGNFGESSGVRVINPKGQSRSNLSEYPEIAFGRSIQVLYDDRPIYNRIIPVGNNGLSIQDATLGSYTTQTGTNPDASSYYYIEDAASIAAYGVWEYVYRLNVEPLSGGAQHIIDAANVLKLAAEAFLRERKDQTTAYSIELAELNAALKVGDTVRLDWKGQTANHVYVDVSQDFYILEINRSRSVSTGLRTSTLLISETLEPPLDDKELVANLFKDVATLKRES
jgi:hypothetical protein